MHAQCVLVATTLIYSSAKFHSFLYNGSKTVRVNMESCYGGMSRLQQRAVTEEGDQFLFNIVTGDESWIHHFDPEEKRMSMQYRHFISSPEKNKNNAVCRQDSFDCFLGLTKSLHDRLFGSWEYCQFSSVH